LALADVRILRVGPGLPDAEVCGRLDAEEAIGLIRRSIKMVEIEASRRGDARRTARYAAASPRSATMRSAIFIDRLLS
jgi:hypothetical protein